MKPYLLIVRGKILIDRPVTDFDLKVFGLYHVTPVFYADSTREPIDIVDKAYEIYCEGELNFRRVDTVELVSL